MVSSMSLISLAVIAGVIAATPVKRADMLQPECNLLQPIDQLADRVCQLCHSYYSQLVPDMRLLCRKDCYTTPTFAACAKIFIDAPQFHL